MVLKLLSQCFTIFQNTRWQDW